MIKGGGFSRTSKTESKIPSSSLADMAFLLLIFFMVTTVFRKDRPVVQDFPDAEAAERADEARRNILNVWVDREGNVFINDQNIPIETVGDIVAPLYDASDRRLLISLRGDRETPYVYIDAVQGELQRAHAVRVNFFTHLEQRIVGERR